jgi:glutaredoxin
MKCEKVAGKHREHHVKIFTLSTCGWCKKTKELLQSLDIEYEYIDVDTLSGVDLKTAREELKRYNPRGSFPTMVIDDGKHVIVGFQEKEIGKVLG